MSEQQESIFRKKNIESIQSPEVLDNYLKVTNPGIWIFLAAVACLLVGTIIWGCLGSIDARADAVVYVANGEASCIVKFEDFEDVMSAGVVTVKGQEYELDTTQFTQGVIEGEEDLLIMAEGGFAQGDYVVAITMKEAPAEGVYSAEVITERIKPITLLLQ